MRRTLKFATLVAVALAFTACTDSVQGPITAPDGAKLAYTGTELEGTQLALFNEFRPIYDALYECTGDAKLIGNKDKDLDRKVKRYAEEGWYTSADNPDPENVTWVAENKVIPDTDRLIEVGKIPADCGGDAQALADEAALLLRAFAGQGEYDGGDEGAVFSCPAGANCDEQTTGPNGVGFTAVAGTFGNDDVFIVFRPYKTPPANAVGNAWLVDLHGFTGEEPGPWTRWFCWNGFVGDTDVSPDPDFIAMVRDPEDGDPEYLPTEWEDGRCEEADPEPLNLVLRGAYKLFAGLPFLPSTADAYNPPRTFGGTGTAASPHWLEDVSPTDDAFGELCLATYAISPPTANAGCGFLKKASECTDAFCTNSNLDQYIHVVETAVPQKISTDDAATLVATAESLKQ
jgi:hypothetical protein